MVSLRSIATAITGVALFFETSLGMLDTRDSPHAPVRSSNILENSELS
jgi:hypothetical protein